MLSQSLFLAFVFAIAATVTGIVLWQAIRSPVERRLATLGEGGTAAAPHEPGFFERLAQRLLPITSAGSRGAAQASAFRARFLGAGLRSPSAPAVYFLAKASLALALPGALFLYFLWSGKHFPAAPLVASFVLLAAIGYFLPNATLSRLIEHRQRELFEVFPDALDLMRVCVESGLSLDASIERVGKEMAFESPVLTDELHLVSLELRAGASRAEALRHFALRVGLEDIDALVSMLVQADRFGTSITEALRVHSEALRTKRKLAAEERAAKLPVKLLFPLVFCIFPALLAVLLGPAVISIARGLPRMFGH